MRTYNCNCGQKLYFENTMCLNCGSKLGFDPASLKLLPISRTADETWISPPGTDKEFKLCVNYKNSQVCNWLIPKQENEQYCEACRLNEIIPDLSKEINQQRWYKLEKAKRRLIYTLKILHLSPIDYRKDPVHGLAFRFMEDIKGWNPFSEEVVKYEQIMIGHNAGTITINIIEADDDAREKIREELNESYRTILGHFRHEIGHYFWDNLIARTDKLDEFRKLFGDERNNYKESLSQYYTQGPRSDWQDKFISAYASSHPWEDWAECWAHYLHNIEILETAQHHQFGIYTNLDSSKTLDFYSWLKQQKFDHILEQLTKLTITLNELNRSLGLQDAYPFKHNQVVCNKLDFIHRIVTNI